MNLWQTAKLRRWKGERREAWYAGHHHDRLFYNATSQILFDTGVAYYGRP